MANLNPQKIEIFNSILLFKISIATLANNISFFLHASQLMIKRKKTHLNNK